MGGLDVAGYSYAFGEAPDDVIDTTATSLDISTTGSGELTDGMQTFWVKAINTAGNGGEPAVLELWIDTTPPQVVTYTPAPASLHSTLTPTATVTVSELHSGVDDDALALLADRAMLRDTGARALRAVIDEYMLESMYQLPDVQSSGVTYIVDAQALENNLSLDDLPQRKAKESA